MKISVLLFLTNFIRTLVIIVVIYYAFRFISRYLLPFVVNKGIKNMQDKINEQQRQSQRSSRQPGEVTVEYEQGNQRNNSQNRGEYVDFEEVE
jgi:cell division protein FtsL